MTRIEMTVESNYTFGNPEGLLAHYTRAAVVFGDILPSGRLRMSPYREMRDPAENKDLVPAIAWRGDRPNAHAALAAAVDQLRGVRDSMRVLSLTHDARSSAADTFACSWARPRMWEHYGDIHRGVCLVFRPDRLEAAVRGQFGGSLYFGKVRYTPAGIAGSSALRTIVEDQIFDDDQREQAVAEHIQTHNQDLFFLKTDDWESEHEYRAVLAAPDEHYAFVDYEDSLVAVILGERFPDWQVPGAREACDAAGVKLLRMSWDLRGRPLAFDVGPQPRTPPPSTP